MNKNCIESLEVDRFTYKEEAAVRNQIVQFYESLYEELEDYRPSVSMLDFSSIEKEDKSFFGREFGKEEVIKAFREMRGDKVFGLDGFTTTFFQHYWWVVEGDIMIRQNGILHSI